MAADVYVAVSAHREALRRRLCEWAGLDTEPEPGSDAALLLDALCGSEPEEYLPRFEASARALAEQGGRIEVRLAGIQRWSEALAHALDDELATSPSLLAQAHETLGRVIAQVAVTLVRSAQSVQAAMSHSEAERARRGMTRLQALQRINAAANSTLDLDQTLSTTAQAVAQEMSADLCAIFLFDEVTRELQLRATNGPYPHNGRHFTLALGEGHTGWVAEHGHPLLVTDAASDPRFTQEANAYAMPYRGVLSVPIIFFTVEKLEGVISVQSSEPRAFSEEEVSFLEIVAGQLAMSIENGRLYEQTDEELRRKVHELSTLHRVSAMVASTLVFEHVLKMIVAQAVQLSGADRSVLFELDPTTRRLSSVASHGFEHPEITSAQLAVGQCCAGQVIQMGEPRMQVDCMRCDESCFLHGYPEAIDDQHSVLCVPLATRHGPLGALCVFSSQRHLLNNHQMQLVMTFANVAAIAMENARLFEQTREGLRTKDVLLREMHHRVKNNLQQVASILNMQARRAKAPEIRQVMIESVDRIQGIAATHDLLSTAQLGVARIDEIARKIVGIVRSNLVPPDTHVRFQIGVLPYYLPSDQATTLAIVLTELIANSIEHGLEGRKRGTIQIGGARVGEHIVVRVADDGGGLPDGFSMQTADGLGLQLVRGLVQSDLHGAVEIFHAPGAPEIGELAERSTDPSLQAVDGGGEAADGERAMWTVVEISLPVSLMSDMEETSLPASPL
jgi:two-component sensor histidine kinase/putative methionine-R-sulfoxide reductase with GAF domain